MGAAGLFVYEVITRKHGDPHSVDPQDVVEITGDFYGDDELTVALGVPIDPTVISIEEISPEPQPLYRVKLGHNAYYEMTPMQLSTLQQYGVFV